MNRLIEQHGLSQRRACRLVGIDHSIWRYQPRRADDAALRKRLRELAHERRRFGYRRLGWLLAREGHTMNSKRLYRLYREEKLMVHRRSGRKRALGTRAPMVLPLTTNQRWSLDFVSDTLSDGRRFRILAIVDDFSRECLTLVVDTSLGGVRVVRELERLALERATPQVIVSDNVLRQESRDTSGQSSPVACGASGFANNCRPRRVASAAAYRQGFARQARRRAPPLTDARAAAGSQLAGA